MAELLGDAAAADSVHDMVNGLLRQAHALWEAEITIHERFDQHTRHLAYQMYPAASSFIAALQPAFVEFWPQHPYSADLLQVIAKGGVNFLSDRVSQRHFRQTGLWSEVYIHLRAKAQVIMGGKIEENRFWTLGLNRLGRDFGPRDRELGEFLQPRLTRLFQRHAQRDKAQWSARLLADANTPFLVVDSAGRVLEMSEGARSLFATTRTPLPADSMIPELRRLWTGCGPTGSIVRHVLGGLEVLAPTTANAGPALVLLGRAGESASAPALAEPLTPRESEILHWIGEGKTNAEIGVVLGISARTVGKHCERLFDKLAVENRLGAALWKRQRG